MPRKILVPVDCSKNSEKAVSHALETAIKFKTEYRPEITLFHVVEEPSNSKIRIGEKYLTTVEKRFKKHGIPVSLKIEQGTVADKITDEAKKKYYDLIIMGTQGVSSRKHQTLGSVASCVVQNAHCPVTVVR